MKVYKCDGHFFSSDLPCQNEEYYEQKGYPEGWLTIKVDWISNQLPNSRLLEAGNQSLHFCSQKCLENYLFKDIKAIEQKDNSNG